MVITRSQGDVAEVDERRGNVPDRRGIAERREASQRELQEEEAETIVHRERLRRLSFAPLATPSMQPESERRDAAGQGVTAVNITPGPSTLPTYDSRRSPAPSVKSTTSVTARLRLAELEAAEKLAALRRREYEMEADLIKKRLAAEVSVIQDEESVHGDPLPRVDEQNRVESWLRNNPPNEGREPTEARTLRFNPRPRSPTPTRPRARGAIEHLADTLEKMARPRIRLTELPNFTGCINEWLPFKAAMKESTRMYSITPAENLLRLRNCLRGEARDAVAALLYTASDPEIIMCTLEQCFGRPEVIIERTIDELKKLPRPGPSAAELNSFAIKIQNVTCVLKNIDRRGYMYNPTLTKEVLEKLSPHMRSRWCDYATESEASTEPELILLSRFLMREADRALRYNYVALPETSASNNKRESARLPVTRTKKIAVYNTERDTNNVTCEKCGQEHSLPQCAKYKEMSVDQRWDFIKEHKLCFKCVASKHRRMTCKAKSCGIGECRRPHHSTLHKERRTSEAEREPTTMQAVLSMTNTQASGPRDVLLKVCPVVVVGPRGEEPTYALLDEGATVTLIDEGLAERIGADGPTQQLNLQGVNMSNKETDSRLVTVHVRGRKETALYKLRARTIRNLDLHKQTVSESLLRFKHLKGLDNEGVCYDRARPGILVGTDHWEYIVSRQLKIGKRDQPAASRTQLGWVIHGTVPRNIIYEKNSVLHVYESEQNGIQDLHNLVQAHFEIDALGVAHKPRVSDADRRATNVMEKSINKTDKGYEIGLPWIQDDVRLPASYNMALRRLRKIETKMDAYPAFDNEYTAQINNLLEKGYAVPCDGTENDSSVCWYLPHFAVENINKPGKIRLVFDAAARSNGVCLNDYLLEGPNLLLSLQGIVFRFREKPVAVTADIKEMFLQIKILQQDQPAQMFLWRGAERDTPPTKYKMSSMIFGAASSPFTAHFVRDYNARAHAQTHPRAVDAITRCHYMDDLVASYEDADEARRTINEVIDVHAAAGFTLRGWSASDVDTLRDVPAELRATTLTQLGGAGPESKILGLVWDAERDELGFNTSMNRVPAEVRAQTRAPTKREALSAVMSIYDPLGLLSHYTIRAKIMLQSLWRLQLTWDQPVPEEEGDTFASWLQRLPEVSVLRLARCYEPGAHEGVELHVFCDASEQAYAAVAYWRVIRRDGTVGVALVAAKAKVAPRRAQTIPRLELQAAVIGARLADTVQREHDIQVTKTYYWLDSMTVVHWIRHDARRYTPFVAHRLGEIAELTHKDEWRWLPTSENVADEATRINNKSINRNDRWFTGPNFLYEPVDRWPVEKIMDKETTEDVFNISEGVNEHRDWTPDPARFSKYDVMIRATARVLAFIDMCRRRATRLELRHIEAAEGALLQRAQRESFTEDVKRLKVQQKLSKSSRLWKLDPVYEEGVLRVRGRIGAADVPAEVKRPTILDGRHVITKLLVLREHCAAGHANRERVTNNLRQKYWIIHLRPTVRAVENSCALCRVRRSRPVAPTTGDLPRARLDPFHRPFTNCGVDYFGPMTVKVGRRHEKRWGALFTCLTTRAVHIEIVSTLSTDSAVMALRRMAARRGWPRLIYSDNATNFKGADHELKAAYAEWAPALRDEALKNRLEWRYIAPGAPNQGGAWERMVRSIKTALHATLREKAPPEEVLKTLLVEAEYSVNARPLTHVSVNPNDPEALTPNHFMLGSSEGLPTTGSCDEADRRTWRASQALADHFWRRWVREYLPTLVPRGEPTDHKRQLQFGDVVLVVDPTLPRNVWPMGIVERTYKGPDGGVRVVDVRTRTGIFKRPASRLVVLIKEEATRAAPGGEL